MSAAPRRSGPGSALLGILGIAVIAGIMITVGVTPALALTQAGAKSSLGLFSDLPADLTLGKLQQKTQIYANKGGKPALLASFYNQNRDVITEDDVSATVKNATLAAEDPRFYEHGGVDPMGIVSALVGNVLHGSNRGASTISQQVVKNVCIQEAELKPTAAEVTAAYDECTGGVQRKLREARLAIGLEKKYSKDQILLEYLNIAGFGGRIYGIQSAAHYYFDVDAKDLSIAQAASLMAIVNNPNVLRIDDPKNYAANKDRRDYVLANELKYKMISQADYDKAVATPIKTKLTPTTTGCAAAGSAGFFCDYVVRTIVNDPIFGSTATARWNRLQSAGWKIYTTLDLDLQAKEKAAMSAQVPAKSPSGTNLAGAAVSVQVGTGKVLAMVQSKRFDDTSSKATQGAGYTATSVNYNTVSPYGGSAGFQPGSSYKAFTLINWLQNGHGIYEQVNGDPRTLPYGDLKACKQPAASWSVGNDEANEGGYQSVLQGTARSVNGVFASMAEKLDLCDIRDVAKSLGVERANGAPLEDNPSSIIGTNTVSPISMATAYAGIANQGVTCSPIVIDHIVDSSGKSDTVKVPSADCHRAIAAPVAIAAGFTLRSPLTQGTAIADRYASGSAWAMAKTGTTDNANSTWVVGGTTKVQSAVWVGNVQGSTSLRKVFGFPSCGGTTQAANARHCIWSAITAAAQAEYPGATSWPQPDQQYLYGQQIAVPNVVGQSGTDARKTLEAAGFQVKVGQPQNSDSVQAGLIAATDPAAGSQASAGSVVTLSKSSGPSTQPSQPTAGTLPNLVGLSLTDARNAISGAQYQLQPQVTYTQQAGQPNCAVLSQAPSPGQYDPAATQVQLSVNGVDGQCG